VTVLGIWGQVERVTRLATEEFIPKFCEKVTERNRGWVVILCGGLVMPVGDADGDQAETETMTVPHRAENVPFSTVSVFVRMSSGCVVRVYGLVGVNDDPGIYSLTRTSAERRGSGKSSLSFLNTGRL